MRFSFCENLKQMKLHFLFWKDIFVSLWGIFVQISLLFNVNLAPLQKDQQWFISSFLNVPSYCNN